MILFLHKTIALPGTRRTEKKRSQAQERIQSTSQTTSRRRSNISDLNRRETDMNTVSGGDCHRVRRRRHPDPVRPAHPGGALHRPESAQQRCASQPTIGLGTGLPSSTGHRLRRGSSGLPAALGFVAASHVSSPQNQWGRPTEVVANGHAHSRCNGRRRHLRPTAVPWRADAPEAMAIPVFSQINSWMCGV